jgi:hypothetical protein
MPTNPTQFAEFVMQNPDKAWEIVTHTSKELNKVQQRARDLQEYQNTLLEDSQEHERQKSELQSRVATTDIEVEELRALLAKLQAQTATPITSAAVGRSQKIKDPEFFEGDRTQYDDWKLSVHLKLSGNSDHFHTEQQKLAYVLGLLRGNARAQMRSFVDSTSGEIQINNLPNFFLHLDRAFGDPDRRGTAQTKLRALRQKNQPFATYYAEFSRLAVDTGYNDVAKKAELLTGLSQELRTLLVNQDYELLSFEDTVTLCQRLDVRQRIFQSQQSSNVLPRARNAAASYVQSRFFTAPVPNTTPRQALATAPEVSAATSASDGTVPMDLSAGRPRGRITEEEKQRRRDAGLCLYCAGEGHLARNCPNRPQARAITGRVVTFGNDSTTTNDATSTTPQGKD